MPAKTYYDILGIDSDASLTEIKQAYRTLARQYHPDTRPDDSSAVERFREISTAYQTLINAEKRAAYDAILSRQAVSRAARAVQQSTVSDDTVSNEETSPPRRMYATYHTDDNTRAFIRSVFMAVLLTLVIILAQVFIFLDSPTPNLINDSTVDAAANTATPRPPTLTPLPEFVREVVPPLSDTGLQNAAIAACTFVLDAPMTTCDLVEVLAEENMALVLRVLPGDYSQVALKVEYDGVPTGWTVNVGNSVANTGTQGDGRIGTSDAQLSIFERDLLVYGNEANNNTQLIRVQHAVDAVQSLFLQVGAGTLVWSSGERAQALTSRYLFLPTAAESAQPEAEVVTFYVALNRVIRAKDGRTGSGVQRVRLWLLP